MTILRNLSIGALCAILLNACACSGSSDDVAFEHIVLTDGYSMTGSADAFESEKNMSIGCQVNILLPTSLYGHDIKPLRDSILMAAFDAPTTASIDSARVAVKNYASTISGYTLKDTVLPSETVVANPSFLTRYDGSVNIIGAVETITPDILSYALYRSTYIPGNAHGDFYTHYLNVDLNNGKLVALSDIFTLEGLKELPQAIATAAHAMRPILGQTEICQLPSSNNYYITAGGQIVFVYAPYEVASYAQGEIRVPIDIELLSTYFTPYGMELLTPQ